MNRTALVTGSARRVGRAIAERLAEDGWRVIIHARQPEAAKQTAAAFGGAAVAGLGADLAETAEIERLALEVIELVDGSLDLLVNAASTFEKTVPWESARAMEWSRAFDVTARAPYLLTAALVPALSAGEGGCVINISDQSPHEAWPDWPLHAAAKAALESLTATGARALEPYAIRVNAVAPGTIMVPDNCSPDAVPEGDRAARQLQEFLDAIVSIANDHNRNGEVLHCNPGHH